MNKTGIYVIPRYIKRLSHFLSQLIQSKAEPHGITNAQLNLLFCLRGNDSTTQNQLLQYLDIKSSTLTVLLKSLEQKGLISRSRDPNDSRAKTLELSVNGKKLIRQSIDPWAEKLDRDLFKGFTESEKKQLLNFFDRLLSNIEQVKNQQ